jgi:hypothetical protein
VRRHVGEKAKTVFKYVSECEKRRIIKERKQPKKNLITALIKKHDKKPSASKTKTQPKTQQHMTRNDETAVASLKAVILQRMRELDDIETTYTSMRQAHESPDALEREQRIALQQIESMVHEFERFNREICDIERRRVIERAQLMF